MDATLYLAENVLNEGNPVSLNGYWTFTFFKRKTDRNQVTYRTLGRVLKIHASRAKQYE